jgi:hypothetical protein
MPRPLRALSGFPVPNLPTSVIVVSIVDELQSIGGQSYRKVEALWFPWVGVEGVVKCKRDKKHERQRHTCFFPRCWHALIFCRVSGSYQEIVIYLFFVSNINCDSWTVRNRAIRSVVKHMMSFNDHSEQRSLIQSNPIHTSGSQSLVAFSFMGKVEVRPAPVSGFQRELHSCTLAPIIREPPRIHGRRHGCASCPSIRDIC